MNKQSINVCKVVKSDCDNCFVLLLIQELDKERAGMLELVARWHLLIYDLFLQSGCWRVGNECIVPFATPPLIRCLTAGIH